MKKKIFAVFSVLMCLVLALCGCGGQEKQLAEWQLQEFAEPVDIHTELQVSYLADTYDSIKKYATGQKELSRPASLELTWSASPIDAGDEIVSYLIECATDETFSDSVQYATTDSAFKLTNLMIGTEYFWRVTARMKSGEKTVSPVSSFTTADSGPRNLYVDGVTNVRDLGGWKTADGGRVKQGMIFRCGRLNKSEAATPEIEITEDGKDTMLYDLGIRTEIDLRMKDAHNHESGGITESPLGDTVEYRNVQLEWDNGNYLLNNLDSVREFFEIASDESNYPFIFHCNIGTDRTGMFAFLINGLLGVSEEDLYRDYLFSNFGMIGGQRGLSNIENNYLKTIHEAEGSALSEKIRNCLVGNGVPAEQLDKIVEILK